MGVTARGTCYTRGAEYSLARPTPIKASYWPKDAFMGQFFFKDAFTLAKIFKGGGLVPQSGCTLTYGGASSTGEMPAFGS